MKSQASALLHVMQGLCKDVLAAYPAIKGIDLDLKRLALYCQARDLALFTLDLPNLDSLLLKGLEDGRLKLEGPLSRRVSSKIKVPRLFSGLWLRVFDRDACLRQDVDATAIFFLRQLCCLGKKIEVDCSPDRIQAVLEDYHGIERQLREPSFDWGLDSVNFYDRERRHSLCDAVAYCRPITAEPLFQTETSGEEGAEITGDNLEVILDRVQKVADLIIGSFEPYNPEYLSFRWESEGTGIGFKHGPGAVAERLGNWEKSLFPSWPDKLQNVFRYEWTGKTVGSSEIRPSRHEVPSRLICVPKTAKGPRLIASEPVSHMWCQQHVLRYLTEQCTSLFGTRFIDFKDQRKSGALVLKASLNRKLATVDLSSASDRLSCWTVERMFRENPSLLTALHAARTRYLRDDVSKVPGFLKLRKFASQGTATTFPVQSLCFLFIAIGACISGDVTWAKIRKLRNQVRVFGDDIIIPSHGYVRLTRIMESLQLKVNVAKSYVKGQFRESCGVDGFGGYDVTPVKPKTLVADSPASCQAVVDTSNNLFVKGLWNASDSLRALFPVRLRRRIRVVGFRDAGFAGLTSYSGSDESHLDKRWNPRLHRYEVRVWALHVRTQERDRQGFPGLLDFFASKHNPWYPRIVSNYREARQTRDCLLWEPLNTHARIDS